VRGTRGGAGPRCTGGHTDVTGEIREEGPVHVAQTGPLSTGKGLREEVTHVAQMGSLPLEGLREERDGRDE
jgi:hypothetical protein